MVHQATDAVNLNRNFGTTEADTLDLYKLAAPEVSARYTYLIDAWVDTDGPAVITSEVAVSSRLTNERSTDERIVDIRLRALGRSVVAHASRHGAYPVSLRPR